MYYTHESHPRMMVLLGGFQFRGDKLGCGEFPRVHMGAPSDYLWKQQIKGLCWVLPSFAPEGRARGSRARGSELGSH